MSCKERRTIHRNCAGFNFRLMQLLGVWNAYTHGIPFWLYRFYMIIVLTIIMIALPFLEVLDAIFVMDDLQLFTENVSLTLLHIGSTIKILNLWWKKAKIYTIIDILERVVRQKNEGVMGRSQDKIIDQAIWEGEMITKVFGILACFAISLSVGFPIWNQSYKQRVFPYRCYIPINTNESIPYWTSYTFIGVSVSWQALLILSHDSLVAVLMMHVIVLINILKSKVETACNIYNSPNDYAAKFENEIQNQDVHSYDQTSSRSTIVSLGQRANHEWTTNLKSCIEHHQEIIRAVFELESMFSNVILLQFAISLVSIGLAGFQVTVSVSDGRLLPTVSYLLCALLELLLFCWYGNEIILQSEALGHSAYICSWYQGDPEFRKILRIFMARIQKPLVLTAGNFCDLSLETFMVIVGRSYSYMAVLNEVNE